MNDLTGAARRGRDWNPPAIASFYALFGYLYCMLAAPALQLHPVVGGALYLVGQVTVQSIHMNRPERRKYLPRSQRIAGMVLGAICGLLALGLLLIYPLAVDLPMIWLMFAIASLVHLMERATSRLYLASFRRVSNRVRRVVRLVEVSALFIVGAALLFFLSRPAGDAWYLLGGYALCCLFRVVSLLRTDESPEARVLGAPDRVQAFLSQEQKVAQVNAYKSFRAIMLITMTALQMTMLLIFTFIGTREVGLIASLLVAFFCTTLSQWATKWLLRRRAGRRSGTEPATVLMIGLGIWLLSLVSFTRYGMDSRVIWSYLTLGFSTVGVTMATVSLHALENDMRGVVQFATGEKPGPALDMVHEALAENAALIGEMLMLLGMMAITLFARGAFEGGSLQVSLQPLLLVPALALVAAAFMAAFRFPLDRKATAKLRAFLMLQENGETNLPLQKQLEDTVVKVHRKRYGIKLIILILRPMFYVRVIGKEKVHDTPGVSTVFTCNHGEVYGPIVTNLYIPFWFRPWVIDEISEPDISAEYLYRNTVSRQKWIPKRLRLPAAKVLMVFLAWIMRSLDGITVYRDNPRELVKTFRETAAAMEAGDNILIFPENPNDESLEEAGYLREGVGEFFSGFAMIAQLYHKKTSKCAQFVPIFADKKHRTLTVGEPTFYHPEAPPREEQQRISDYLRGEMLRMAALPPEGGAA
ncbi:MAG: lysophospholipid acyltransferase family protein [Eubacteriales bacterium]|nr:lysophospholipid acyltransferase family protein [Eubacteriales bacterium]